MSNKYFSLIHEGTLHQSPAGKILPAAAFSDLLNSEELLQKVQEDAELYKKEVVAEIEKLKEQAQKEGFALGYQEWTGQMKQLEAEIAKVRQEMQKLVLPVALKAAKKIVAAELKTAP